MIFLNLIVQAWIFAYISCIITLMVVRTCSFLAAATTKLKNVLRSNEEYTMKKWGKN